MIMKKYETTRLILRQWQESDIVPFAEMNSDLEVMKYFPKTLSFNETLEMYNSFKNSKNDFRFSPAEEKISGKFIGFVGLNIPSYMPTSVEIGWRLQKEFWGKGLASEAAKKWLEIGFGEYGLDEIISFTAKQNIKSQEVMKRIGMKRDEKRDFFHPKIPKDHPLAFHVFYALQNFKEKNEL
jgi:ribosomal-protein-alanine N-acetyltransferase